MGVKVALKGVRLTFPELWEPKEFKTGDGRFRYSASFLIEPGSENDKKIRAAIVEAATEAFGEKGKAKIKQLAGDSGKFCYQDGDLKEYDGFAGNWCLATHRRASDGVPAIVGRKGKLDVLTVKSGKPYAGCYVNASVEIYVQKGEFPGFRGSFSGMQFVEDGDAFSGNVANADDFEALDEPEDDGDFGDMDSAGAERAASEEADDDGF